jgi:hypothetical protein
MPPLSKSTSAAALLLAFAPLAVPDMAAATTVTTAPAPTEERADASVEPEAPGEAEAPVDSGSPVEPEAPVDSGSPVEPEAPADTAAPVDAEPVTDPDPAPTTAPAPTRTPEAQPTTDEVTPNETPINVYVQGATDAIGQPGQRFETSIFNVKNASSFTIPRGSLDFHWTIDGPATFTRGRPPFSVANSGTANVANCTFTSPTQTDCLGGNPQPLYTGGANYNHIRVPITVDASALPGDVVTVHGSFAPNAATDYVNTNEQTTSTWKVTIPLTPAVIDEPTEAVGPKPTITGQGVPGGTVDVTVGDRAPVNIPVGDDGTWSLPVTEALSDGSVTVTAVQHRNGFTAEATTAALDVDATAPDVPIVDDPGTLADPTGPITGTADPGSIVIVRDEAGNELGRDRANEDGDFSVRLDTPLPEGATDLVVVAADARRPRPRSSRTPQRLMLPSSSARTSRPRPVRWSEPPSPAPSSSSVTRTATRSGGAKRTTTATSRSSWTSR